MTRNTILPTKILPTSFASSTRIGDLVRSSIFLVRYPVVTMKFLLVCPEIVAVVLEDAIQTTVMFTIVMFPDQS